MGIFTKASQATLSAQAERRHSDSMQFGTKASQNLWVLDQPDMYAPHFKADEKTQQRKRKNSTSSSVGTWNTQQLHNDLYASK